MRPSCICRFRVAAARLWVLTGGGEKYCALSGGFEVSASNQVIGRWNISRLTHCAASLNSASGGMNFLFQGYLNRGWGFTPGENWIASRGGRFFFHALSVAKVALTSFWPSTLSLGRAFSLSPGMARWTRN